MKLCIDCKHLHSHGAPYYDFAICRNKDAFPLNLVTGVVFETAKDPYVLRANSNLCGPDAKHFEPKEVKLNQEDNKP